MNLEYIKKQGALVALKEELNVRITNMESCLACGDFKKARTIHGDIGELLAALIIEQDRTI